MKQLSNTGRMWTTDIGTFIVLNDTIFVWYNNYTQKFDDDILENTIEGLDKSWIGVV